MINTIQGENLDCDEINILEDRKFHLDPPILKYSSNMNFIDFGEDSCRAICTFCFEGDSILAVGRKGKIDFFRSFVFSRTLTLKDEENKLSKYYIHQLEYYENEDNGIIRLYSELLGEIFYVDLLNDYKVVFLGQETCGKTHLHQYVKNITIFKDMLVYGHENRKRLNFYHAEKLLLLYLVDLEFQEFCFQIHEIYDDYVLVAGNNILSLVKYKNLESSEKAVKYGLKNIGKNSCLYSCMKIHYEKKLLLLADQYGIVEIFSNYIIETDQFRKLFEVELYSQFSWIYSILIDSNEVICSSRCEGEIKLFDLVDRKVVTLKPENIEVGNVMDLRWEASKYYRNRKIIFVTNGGVICQLRNLRASSYQHSKDLRDRLSFVIEDENGLFLHTTLQLWYKKLRVFQFLVRKIDV